MVDRESLEETVNEFFALSYKYKMQGNTYKRIFIVLPSKTCAFYSELWESLGNKTVDIIGSSLYDNSNIVSLNIHFLFHPNAAAI